MNSKDLEKKRVLCLFTNQFPYGKGEAYLETEIMHYEAFEHVYILALQLRRKNAKAVREVPRNVTVIPVPFNIPAYILNIFKTILDGNFYRELGELLHSRRFSLRTLAQLVLYISRSHYEARYIVRKLRGVNLVESVFYSYRFGYQPYVACLVRDKLKLSSKIIARAHRYDLYENKKKSGYIPMRRYLLSMLAYVFPVSNNGREYLRNCYPEYANKIQTKFLGTIDYGETKHIRGDVFKIVTCSNVVPVKRIDLIIEALSLIQDINIEWTHYGQGLLFNEMKVLANDKLHQNIVIHWKGAVENKLVLNDYKSKDYHLFLNVSTSEGIPVSIMEANSFGIPCIATDVGGTGELVADGINGTLLLESVTAEELAEEIRRYAKMQDEEYERYCQFARKIWNEKFNSDANYGEFVKALNGMFVDNNI